MIRRPIHTSRDLLALLDRAPRLNIAFDEAFRTLATDIVALQAENQQLRDTTSQLLRELTALRATLATHR